MLMLLIFRHLEDCFISDKDWLLRLTPKEMRFLTFYFSDVIGNGYTVSIQANPIILTRTKDWKNFLVRQGESGDNYAKQAQKYKHSHALPPI